MKTCALFGICLFVTSVSLAQNHWVSNVTAAANGSYIESFSYAERVDDDGNDAYGYIQGNHCIDYSDISASPYASYCESFDVFHRAYSGHINIAAQVGCHTANLFVTYTSIMGGESDSLEEGAQACVLPPPCHLDVYQETDGSTSLEPGTGDYQCGTTQSLTATAYQEFQFDGWTGDVTSPDATIAVLLDRNKSVTAHFSSIPPPTDPGPTDIGDACNPQCSPIIINFENGDYRLTGPNAPVSFDMAGNGHPLLMGWTAAGSDEAFLWLDRNGNGRVTSGAELFGNFTPLRNGQLAKNGFEALAEYDANHDGVIDERDPIWSELLLWRDLNHDGISEPNEISRLDASDVRAIDLHYHWTGRLDHWGNTFRYESLIFRNDQSSSAVRKQPVYDIFFVPVSK